MLKDIDILTSYPAPRQSSFKLEPATVYIREENAKKKKFDLFPVFFGSVSSLFWVSFRFSEKVLNSQFVDRFPPFFLGGSVSSFFGSVSGFQKKFQTLSLLIGFPFFLVSVSSFRVHFRFSEKVVNSQFVDQFPLGVRFLFFWVHIRFS